jgi:hypothetical protein
MSSLHKKPEPGTEESGMGPTQGPQNTAELEEARITMPIKWVVENWWSVMSRWMNWVKLGIAM